MNEIWNMAVVFGVGLILGGVFYGGLWWTLQKSTVASRPFLWLFVSSWLRIGISLAGLYITANGDWIRFAICLVGFIFARIIIARLIYKRMNKTSSEQ